MTAQGGRSFVGAFGLVLCVMAGLFVFDVFLAKVEREETGSRAAQLAGAGARLLAAGDGPGAVKKLEEAVAEERTNREYRRRLAEAQLAAGRAGDAAGELESLLQGDSMDGMANLLLGRVLVRQGRLEEGISYFHRAVYGRWGKDAAAKRLAARFELIELLAGTGMKADLLAELLAVQDQVSSVEERLRLGGLFLAADAPGRALELYRGILRDDPENLEAREGWGKAEFARGNYRVAARELRAVVEQGRTGPGVAQMLATLDALFAEDPTVRGLGPEEKLRRSRAVLEQTAKAVGGCAAEGALLQDAAQRVSGRVPAGRQLAAAEGDLDLAERLWQTAKRDCHPVPGVDAPLGIILGRLAQ